MIKQSSRWSTVQQILTLDEEETAVEDFDVYNFDSVGVDKPDSISIIVQGFLFQGLLSRHL